MPVDVTGTGKLGRCSAVLRFDPFTDVDALTRSLMSNAVGTSRVPQFMPMDLYR